MRWLRTWLVRWLREELHADRLTQPLIFGDPARAKIHATAVLNDALLNVTSGIITVAQDAFLGHGVMLLTGTHDITQFGIARQQAVPQTGRDIRIEEGAWIASRAVVLGPCVIGAHAVIAAGAVVTTSVEPYAIVAGVPAQVVGSVIRSPASRSSASP